MPRGSAPGERRGGRQKGVRNKSTLDIEAKLRALGCDPIKGMAMIAMREDASLELRGKMLSELAQYIAPKRRATELTGSDGGPVVVEWLPPPAA